LPSKNELNELYEQRIVVGISSGDFWSSTQYTAAEAYDQNFSGTVTTGIRVKNYTSGNARAVRAF
jgi:hypothetical protein